MFVCKWAKIDMLLFDEMVIWNSFIGLIDEVRRTEYLVLAGV